MHRHFCGSAPADRQRSVLESPASRGAGCFSDGDGRCGVGWELSFVFFWGVVKVDEMFKLSLEGNALCNLLIWFVGVSNYRLTNLGFNLVLILRCKLLYNWLGAQLYQYMIITKVWRVLCTRTSMDYNSNLYSNNICIHLHCRKFIHINLTF